MRCASCVIGCASHVMGQCACVIVVMWEIFLSYSLKQQFSEMEPWNMPIFCCRVKNLPQKTQSEFTNICSHCHFKGAIFHHSKLHLSPLQISWPCLMSKWWECWDLRTQYHILSILVFIYSSLAQFSNR